jgi:hypothetical protein
MSYLDKPNAPEDLLHSGVKGMHWGVRKDRPGGVSRSVDRSAKKDAKEFARAKMFYGEGAGNRRKLIKGTVEGKSKNTPGYKEAFDHHLGKQDMSKHASKAQGERKRKNVVNSTAKTARGVRHVLNGNSQYASLAAAMLVGGVMYAHKTGIDKVVAGHVSQTYSKVKQEHSRRNNSASDFLRGMGMNV